MDNVAHRLSDLESDSFQLKLRNYYLERRLNATLSDRDQNEDHLASIVQGTEPGVRRHPTTDLASRGRSDHPLALETMVDALERERSRSRRLEMDKEKEVATARAEIESMRTEIRQVDELRSQLREARMAEASLRTTIARLEAERDKLAREAEAQRLTAEDLVAFEAERIADLERDNELLQRRITDLEDRPRITTAAADTLRRDIERSFDFLRSPSSKLAADVNDKVRTLLLQGQNVVDDARRNRIPVDARLADCLDHGLKLAPPSPPNRW